MILKMVGYGVDAVMIWGWSLLVQVVVPGINVCFFRQHFYRKKNNLCLKPPNGDGIKGTGLRGTGLIGTGLIEGVININISR
jgi:hypothetical protein